MGRSMRNGGSASEDGPDVAEELELETVSPFKEGEEAIEEAGGAESSRLCYQCGKCDVVCPWNRVRSFSIRRIIREASLGLSEIEDEDIWRCTTCGTCPSRCPRGVEQIDIGVALRRVASEYDVFPAAVRSVRGARGSLASDGNPLNEARDDRAAWLDQPGAEGLSVPAFEEGMEFLYFVGCYYSYDPRMKKVAVATAKVLDRAGVSFGILGSEESCCGESIRKTGSEEVFRQLAKQNIKTFIDRGVKKLLVSSPHCYHTFRNEYPEFMVSFEVVHISQLLSQLIAEGKLDLGPIDLGPTDLGRGEHARKVTYHDPCYLGRHNGVYDEPRTLLEKVPGLELVEMRESREASLCCGGGGGRVWMDTPKEERFSDLRYAQARETGASVLVTSCPYCITNFEESRLGDDQGPDGEATLEVKDITEIIAEALD